MSEFQTGLGDRYRIERRFPRPAWRPRYRGVRDGAGDLIPVGVDDSFFGWIGAIVAVVFIVVVLLPLALFVLELAAFIALLLPLLVLGITLGIVRHTVVVRRVPLAGGEAEGTPLDSREVRGMLASLRAARELRSAAEAGAYRVSASAAGSAELIRAGTALWPPKR